MCNIPQRESNSIGRIRPELYQADVMRQWSADSGADLLPEGAEQGAACGKLQFMLRYDHDVEGLVVRVSVFFHIYLKNQILFCIKKYFWPLEVQHVGELMLLMQYLYKGHLPI